MIYRLKSILIILSLFILISCESSKETEQVVDGYINRGMLKKDDKGVAVRDGKWIKMDNSKRVIGETEYKMGKRNGLSVVYGPNNQKALEAYYKDDKKDGILKEYNTKGKLVKEANYKEDKLDGPYFEDKADGQHKGQYKSEKKDGEWTHVWPSGAKSVFTYKNDIFDGPHKQLFRDGVISRIGQYKNGKPVGEWKEWYTPKQLSWTAQYDDDGNKHGKWFVYFENGKLKEEAEYDHGKMTAIKQWDDKGRLFNQAKR